MEQLFILFFPSGCYQDLSVHSGTIAGTEDSFSVGEFLQDRLWNSDISTIGRWGNRPKTPFVFFSFLQEANHMCQHLNETAWAMAMFPPALNRVGTAPTSLPHIKEGNRRNLVLSNGAEIFKERPKTTSREWKIDIQPTPHLAQKIRSASKRRPTPNWTSLSFNWRSNEAL
jgi:hypothetical protein